MTTPDRYAASRRSARSHLSALARAAAIGGVALAAVSPALAQAVRAPSHYASPASPSAERGARVAGPLGAERNASPVSANYGQGYGAGDLGLTDVGFISTPSIVDLDGDGDLDVLVGEYYGDFTYFENTALPGAAPTYGPAQVNPFGLVAVDLGSVPAVVDLDGDGDLDVLAGSYSGSFAYYRNTAGAGATPAFAPPEINPFGLTGVGGVGSATSSHPSVADLDGDGDLDVLSGRSDGDLVYFENTAGPGGSPVFAPRQANPFGLTNVMAVGYGYDSKPAVADLDGDGDLDVLAGLSSGTLTFFRNAAGPGAVPAFAPKQASPFGFGDVGYRSSPAVADLDADGDADVLVGSFAGDIAFFLNVTRPGQRPIFRRPDGATSAPGGGRRAGLAPAGEPITAASVSATLTSTMVTPNPARGAARFTVAVAEPERVRVVVSDALGREVDRLHDGELSGTAELTLDTSRLAPGVYVVRVEGETATEVRRLTVVR